MLSFIGNLDSALDRLKTGRSSLSATNGPSDNGWNNHLPPTTGAGPTGPRPDGAGRPWVRYAQSQTIYTQPQFYSPIHTPQNWQIPQKRREVYQWLRYFAENEPKVAAALDFYASFPMNGFETQCDDAKIKRFYDNFNKKINLDYWCKAISREYYMIGDVFPFLEIECSVCRGSNIDKNNPEKLCRHKNGSFSRMVILNPDWIDVQQNQFAGDPIITLIPDDDLKRVVWRRSPRALYERLPPHIRQLILGEKPIPLDNNNVSHMKFNPYPYGVYGTSIIRRLFKTLTYKDKLMTAQWIVAERLILPIRIVKVGDADRPAGPADIADVQQQLAQTANDPNLTLVTHHAFDYDWIGSNGKILTLSNEFDLINKEILQGLMINEALLSGEMAGYQSAAIGAEALIQRMESWRLELARWIEDRIYKPLAMMKGFRDDSLSDELKEDVWIYPHIMWNDLNLRDDTQQKQILMQLHDKKVLSTETLCEKVGLHYDQEVERLRFEAAQMQIGGAGGAGGAGGGGMGGAGGGGGGGGAPPGGDMGGQLFGGQPGGADMGAGGAGPDAGAAGLGAPAGPMASSVGGSTGKVLTKNKASKAMKPMEEEQAQPSQIRLTSLEQIMYKMLAEMRNQLRFPFNPFAQYPLGQYRADFAIPQIKLDIECDGDAWHSHPDKKASDQKRDAELARFGWTTVRFKELDLKENKQEVSKTVAALIFKLWKKALENQKQQGKAQKAAAMDIPFMDKFGEVDDFELIDLTQRFTVSSLSLPLGILPMDSIEAFAQLGMIETGETPIEDETKIVEAGAQEEPVDGNTDQGQGHSVEGSLH